MTAGSRISAAVVGAGDCAPLAVAHESLAPAAARPSRFPQTADAFPREKARDPIGFEATQRLEESIAEPAAWCCCETVPAGAAA